MAKCGKVIEAYGIDLPRRGPVVASRNQSKRELTLTGHAQMSAVIERQLNLISVQMAWQGLNKLVPLGPIVSAKDFELRVGVMDELLDKASYRQY